MNVPHTRRFAAALLCLATLGACDDAFGPGETVHGSGYVVAESRSVRDLHAISLGTLASVHVQQGSGEWLRVEGEDNIVAQLRTRVRGGVLEVDAEPGVRLRPTRPLRVVVGVRDVSALHVSGSGSIVADDLLAEHLSLRLTSSGGIDLANLDAYVLAVTHSGSGTIHADGIADEQDVQIGGSGRYAARYLQSFDARVRVGGSGEATVRVRDRLRAVVSGSGRIRYHGSPWVERTVTGSGDVIHAGP
jgi:hypothetical protein